MNEDIGKGVWHQVKGNLKAAFGRLTDDDVMEIEGNYEAGVGRLQERYGYTREEAETEWNRFRREHGF